MTLNLNSVSTMISKLSLRSLFALLAVVLVAASCADNSDPLTFGRPQLDVDVKPYQALMAPGHTDVTVTAVLDRKGGYLTAPAANGGANSYGYVLYVEPNTVKKPTTFTMRVVGGTMYHVDLHATQTLSDGTVIDVGQQFQKPVYLALQVKDSPSMPSLSSLIILYVPDDGSTPVPVRSGYDVGSGYLIGVLDHFSQYTAAWN